MLGVSHRKDIVDQLLAIEQEVDNMEIPHKSDYSCEDDLYQAQLEYQWWIDDNANNYKVLANSIGYTKRRLFPKDLRRKL